MTKQENDLNTSINLLGFYLEHYSKGKVELYLPMSVELRKLLCDNQPLVKLFPDFKLHKLNFAKLIENHPSLGDGLLFSSPGRSEVNEHGIAIFTLLFSNPFELLTLDKWLNQPFLSSSISLREFIKSVADKEAAHSDPSYNATLTTSKSVQLFDAESHKLHIYGISRYIYDIITNQTH